MDKKKLKNKLLCSICTNTECEVSRMYKRCSEKYCTEPIEITRENLTCMTYSVEGLTVQAINVRKHCAARRAARKMLELMPNTEGAEDMVDDAENALSFNLECKKRIHDGKLRIECKIKSGTDDELFAVETEKAISRFIKQYFKHWVKEETA